MDELLDEEPELDEPELDELLDEEPELDLLLLEELEPFELELDEEEEEPEPFELVVKDVVFFWDCADAAASAWA